MPDIICDFPPDHPEYYKVPFYRKILAVFSDRTGTVERVYCNHTHTKWWRYVADGNFVIKSYRPTSSKRIAERWIREVEKKESNDINEIERETQS